MSVHDGLQPDDLLRIETIGDARIAPDGRTIAYAVQTPDLETNRNTSAIWLAPTEGGAPRRFTSGPKVDAAPRWSPDGRRLAFISDRSGQRQIWLIEREGGEASRLTDWPHGITDLAWSPDAWPSRPRMRRTTSRFRRLVACATVSTGLAISAASTSTSGWWIAPAAKRAN